MRACLQHLGDVQNFGLAYDTLGPPPRKREQKEPAVDPSERKKWLNACVGIATPDDYRIHYARWQRSFGPSTNTRVVKATSRLLIGHGNASAGDVGLTVHRTWGTPVIPGTALKGLLSSYVDAVYGPDPSCSDRARDKWAAPTWANFEVKKAPGELHALIFGAPAVRSQNLPDRRGGVTFHDALYIPSDGGDPCYAVDVLTAHQKPYYDEHGGKWPNDWNSLGPVPFLTVRPYVRFLLALEGPPRATELAMTMLTDALSKWGAGAKTSLGYGTMAHDLEYEKSEQDEEKERKRIEQEAKERQKRFDALTPVERKIEEMYEKRTDKGLPKSTMVLQKIEMDDWPQPDEREQVVKWLRQQMKEENCWRETSTAKKPLKDRVHQRTLKVLEWLKKYQ